MSWELLLTPWALGVVGLVVGSFLNVVVHRLPQMQDRGGWSDLAAFLGDADSHQRVFGQPPPAELAAASGTISRQLDALSPLDLVRPASRCPACGHRIRWYENVPVLSWLVLRARCSDCGTRIPARYPFIEIACGALFAASAWLHPMQPVALLWCGLFAALLALSAIDWDTTFLPDVLTLPLLWAGLVCAAFGWLPGLSVATSVLGAALGYLSLWSVYQLFKLATGREGMGYGDFKLLAALGAWLGWQAILPIVLMASAIGAVVGLAMKASGALREGLYVPFGPFLAGGGVAVKLIGLPVLLGWMGWG